MTANAPLLPQGLRDLLPPDSGHKATAVENIVHHFAAYGYERVDPPLAEFEESLLSGDGQAMDSHIFRLTDPVSHKSLGLRADMTPQVARIATTRLGEAERPLRLFYCGQVLRVKSGSTRPDRQFTQAGAELIGSDRLEADAEIILLAVETLTKLGVKGLSVDISLPTIVRSLLEDSGLSETEAKALKAALNRKDVTTLMGLKGSVAQQAAGLVQAAGRADVALAKLAALQLPEIAQVECQRLRLVVDLLNTAIPDLTITIDPAEHRGFEYQTGLSFTFFARGVRGELGSGGRYQAGIAEEPATGFSLYVDVVLRALPKASSPDRLYCPYGTDFVTIRQQREKGWITIMGLEPERDAVQEAKRLRCTYSLADGNIHKLT